MGAPQAHSVVEKEAAPAQTGNAETLAETVAATDEVAAETEAQPTTEQ